MLEGWLAMKLLGETKLLLKPPLLESAISVAVSMKVRTWLVLMSAMGVNYQDKAELAAY